MLGQHHITWLAVLEQAEEFWPGQLRAAFVLGLAAHDGQAMLVSEPLQGCSGSHGVLVFG